MTQVDAEISELRASLRELLAALVRRAFGIALDQVEELAEGLDAMVARGGPTVNALFGGALAHLEGRNRFWAAARRAVASLSAGQRAALVAILVLAVVLLPITVLLVLLALIVCSVLISLARPNGAKTRG